MPASMQGAWALFVDYLGLGEYLQEGREGGSGSGNGDVEGATRQGEGKGEGRCASEEEEAEDGASLGMAVEGLRLPGPAAAWAGGGGPCSVAPLVFDVVSKGG